MKTLTWDDLGKLYTAKTGKSYRIISMENIFIWAKSQSNIKCNKNGTLELYKSKTYGDK